MYLFDPALCEYWSVQVKVLCMQQCNPTWLMFTEWFTM